MKTFLEASILVQAGLGIAPLPEGMEKNLSRDVSVFSIEGDSFRIRTVALRLLPSVSLAGDHFFQLIREDQAAAKVADAISFSDRDISFRCFSKLRRCGITISRRAV